MAALPSLFISVITVLMVPFGINDSGRMSRIRCQPTFVDSTPISVVRTTYLLQVEPFLLFMVYAFLRIVFAVRRRSRLVHSIAAELSVTNDNIQACALISKCEKHGKPQNTRNFRLKEPKKKKKPPFAPLSCSSRTTKVVVIGEIKWVEITFGLDSDRHGVQLQYAQPSPCTCVSSDMMHHE